jgi:HAD superfamily hydrolase (TIGR01509 family)
MEGSMTSYAISAVLFDFGGVLAEEGFRNGLGYIASLNGIDEQEFFSTTQGLISSGGYLTGRCSEQAFWEQLRRHTGVRGTDEDLKEIILARFTLRAWMISLIKVLKEASIRVAILSDQTNWLDELDERLHFFSLFERVFNSYHLGKSKHDPSLFTDVLVAMGLEPGQTLFVDDTMGHVQRARSCGIHAIHYEGKEQFMREMAMFFPGIVPQDSEKH